MRQRGQVKVVHNGAKATVVGSGEMDLRISGELDDVLERTATETSDIAIDFTGASFIDSAILASLVRISKTLLDRKTRLNVIVAAGSHPEYVLKTVGFGALMDIGIEADHAHI